MLRSRWPNGATRAGKLSGLSARFLQNRDAASAVEFALVSMIFIATILMAMAVALVLFLQQQLDFATTKAARQIMSGVAQRAGYSSSVFRTNAVCAALPSVFACADVIVNVQTVQKAVGSGGYYTFVTSGAKGLIIPQLSNTISQYSPGVQGSYEYVQVIYPITLLPSLVLALISNQTYNGNPAYLAVSTAAFRNEQY